MFDYIPCKEWFWLWVILIAEMGLALSVLVVPWLVDTTKAVWNNRKSTKVPHEEKQCQIKRS